LQGYDVDLVASTQLVQVVADDLVDEDQDEEEDDDVLQGKLVSQSVCYWNFFQDNLLSRHP
jgi:hypothetical protein